MAAFRYTHALVCRIPDSWATKALGAPEYPLQLDRARQQHQEYVHCLRKLGIDVIELPPDEGFPDCVYIEDTAVVCNGLALITKPGHASRKNETDIVNAILKKEIELPTIEILDKSTKLDGGDVLFTGREFFVGISHRTNEQGAKAVASAFPEYPCTPIEISNNLHLKSVMTMAGPDIICVGCSQDAQKILKKIQSHSTYHYTTLQVPDPDAANCIFANGALIHRSGVEFPESAKIFEEKIPFPLIPIDYSEVAKPQAALTCCSLLVQKVHQTR